ncbi:vacuolar protein sorting-associated protein 26-domain-containing protein [Lanmaoa asiatica]|nr:vacuolar protein sorting-associated protein 26-domain-containing protein [Lanmaoa asiatica]
MHRNYVVPWSLSQSPDSPVIGLLKPEIIDALLQEPEGTFVLPQRASPGSIYRVSFHPSIDTPSKRTDVMKKICERWRDSATIFQDVIGPKKWRNELYPVYRNPFSFHLSHDPGAKRNDSDTGNYLFEMERSACALFGVPTYGVHMTIYHEDADGSNVRIWTPTRSRTKQTWPGYLDNSVAGGIPSGMSIFENLVKESMEEASIGENIVRTHAKCAGSVSYYFQSVCSISASQIYVYDLKVPPDVDPTPFQPKPLDGEVESFDLLPLDVVIAKMKKGLFKPNCAVVLIDFLVRRGYLTPDNEPNFMEIVTRMHTRFEFERWWPGDALYQYHYHLHDLATMAYFFASPVDVDIKLDGEELRKQVDMKGDKDKLIQCPVYYDGDSVSGQVTIRVRDGKRMTHEGIKVEFVGTIELFYDRGNHHEFLSLSQELASPGELRQAQTFEFLFKNVEKQFESYQGINVKLRYLIRVTVSRRIADVTKEKELWVHSYRMPPDSNNAIKMEVGIEDCLHIEFEYNKSKYHLKDVIVGKIYFLLVRIKIKHMELSIIRRETTGSPPNQYNESETITKFEIMDGAPVRGETIPIRLFLGGFDLTPTFREVNKKFSTRYYLNLVLIDEENRRYFKQQRIALQEITIFRIPEN